MPYPNFHAVRIQDPDNYSKKRYSKDEFGPGIDVIWGIGDSNKVEVQAIRFSIDKFTEKQARDWLKKHPEHKQISFEAATPVKAQTQKQDPLDQFQRTLWDLQYGTAGYAQAHYCPTCRLNKVEGHDAILQGLDRKVGNLMFGKEQFIPTVNDWNTRPIVFAKLHPDPIKFDADMEAELTRIQGGITGELSNAAIENVVGQPRLNVRKNYSDDIALRFYDEGKISVETLNRSYDAIPLTLKLIADKKLAHSSAFLCPDDKESLYGVVKPHHVLDFEETPFDKPVDPMTAILNKQEIDNVTEDEAHLNVGKVISTKNESKLRSAMDAFKKFFEDILNSGAETTAPAVPEPAQTNKTEGEMNKPDGEPLTVETPSVRQDQKMTEEKIIVEDPKVKELSDANAKLQKELEDSKAALKVLEDAKVQAQKAAFDTAWAGLKATIIPPGEIKDPADEAKLQKMSTEDPLGFAAKVASWKSAPAKGEEGSTHTQGPGGAEDHNAKLNRILAESTPAIPGRLH